MNESLQLPPELARILAAPDSTIAEVTQSFERTRLELHRQSRGADEDPIEDFVDSLRLKTMLDETEALEDVNDRARLGLLVHGEFQLCRLNMTAPLRRNPFLCHWVEVVQRWEKKLDDARTEKLRDAGPAHASYWWIFAYGARLGIVKAFLMEEFPQNFYKRSPIAMERELRNLWHTPLDVTPFIQFLKDDGIYEVEPSQPTSSSPNGSITPTQDSIYATPRHRHFTQSSTQSTPTKIPSPAKVVLDGLQDQLYAYPERTYHHLVNLPVDLPSLELINSLLATPDPIPIDRASLARNYIQHALRTLEHTPAPALSQSHGASLFTGQYTTTGGSARATANSINGGDHEHSASSDDDVPPDREAHIRAIKLLVLFVENLLRKGLCPLGDVYFEIQEICTRFLWVREVRQFRKWVEEGGEAPADGDAALQST